MTQPYKGKNRPMIGHISKILNNFFYNLFGGKRVPPRAPVVDDRRARHTEGIDGPLSVDALLVRDRERDKLVLVVDQDLGDIPAWVDWEMTSDTIGIAQQNGAYATIGIKVAPVFRDELKGSKRLLIVTRKNELNIVHHVPFIVRDY